MKKKTLRIGLIGCGGMGRWFHVHHYYAHEPRVELVPAAKARKGGVR